MNVRAVKVAAVASPCGMPAAVKPIELGTTGELIREPAIDVGAHEVKGIDTGVEPVDDLEATRDSRQLDVELLDHRFEPDGLLRRLLHLRQLPEHGVDLTFDLRRLCPDSGHSFAKRLERRAVDGHPFSELHGLRMGLVELVGVLAKRLEIRPALPQAVVAQ